MITNKLNLPRFWVQAVEHQLSSHKSQADYSVTELLDAPRRVRLLKQYRDNIDTDASETVWAIFGTATHAIIEFAVENTNDGSLIAEQRMFAEFNGVTISGAFDIYDKNNGIIYDVKTSTAADVSSPDSPITIRKNKEREAQLNCYAYLARKEGYEVKGLANVLLLRDWIRSKSMRERNYPLHQVAVQEKKMWSDQEVETFIQQRIAIHERAKQELPYCTDEEQWKTERKFAVESRNASRAHKLTDTDEEAVAWKQQNAKGQYISERPRKSVRCEDFCAVKPFCTQYRTMVR